VNIVTAFPTVFTLCFSSLHWYLAIIYQPEYTLRPPQPLNSPVTRKRKRDEELSVDSAIEASELRETPSTTSKPTSKVTTEISGVSEIEIVLDSRSSSPRMEVEEQTQTDETTKPEEQEVESQLCADVSSVSLGEHEQEGSDDREGAGEAMEIDDSPLTSPMHVDLAVPIEDLTRESTPHGTVLPSVAETGDTVPNVPAVDMEDPVGVQAFYGTKETSPKTYGKRGPRVSAPAKLQSGPNGGDPGGDIEITPQKR